MGISMDTAYREEELPLQHGDRIVLFSDGLYSNATKDEEYFSTTRTGTIFQGAHGGTHFSDDVIRLVMADRIMHGRPTVPLFADDVTIVSLMVY